MNFALIIQGTSGSGKTTLGRKIAVEQRAIFLEHDWFLFAVQPYRPESKEHFTLGNAHLWCCFKNAVVAKKDVILEGALVSHDTMVNDFDLKKYLTYLKQYDYRIIRIMLTSSYEIADVRMSARAGYSGHVDIVPKDIYDKLSGVLEATVPSSVQRFDSTNCSIDELSGMITEKYLR
jgi:predicted ABC-type ATPase